MLKHTGKYWLIVFLIVSSIFLPWLCGLIWFGQKINSYAVNNGEHTDAIVVLTGGRNRIAVAVQLLNRNMADHLFISGVEKHTNINDIADKLGFAIDNREKIELGYQARSTIENAQEIKDWIKRNNINSIRLITSNYHTPRSLAELEAYHLPLNIIPSPVYSDRVAQHWWQSWGTFKLIIGEYNKYLVVLLRNFITSKQ